MDALYRKYSQALGRFLARQRLSRDEVADIVQETYRRIQQSELLDTLHNPKAFVFRVANNVRLNQQKRCRAGVKEESFDIGSIEIEAEDPGPYRQLQGEQEWAIVRAAFYELAPICQDAFYMNRFENMTFAQISLELNLSVSMIEKHVSHAIAHMRKRLSETKPSLARKIPQTPKKQS